MSTKALAAVLARLKHLTGAETDAELSRSLSVSPQTLSSWKVRDSIPYSLCVEIAQQHACSLDWLLLGQAYENDEQAHDWERDALHRLRKLSPTERQAVLLFIQEKQRIQQLEQQVSDLTARLLEPSSG